MGQSIVDVTDIATWQQMSGEGPEAYDAFRNYVATGLESEDGLRRKRSLERAIETSRIAPGILKRWHETYSWEGRAKAYDLYIAQVKGAALARRSSLYQEAQTDLAAICAIEASRLLKAAKDPSAPPMAGKDLVKMLETLVKLDRLNQGLSTDNVAVATQDMSKLSDAEADLMHALLLKTGTGL